MDRQARRRIGFLERALASTHDLESQFTSFLSEVAQGDHGPGQPAGAAAAADSAWGSIRGLALGAMLGGGGGGGGVLDRLDLLAHEPPRADAIPSDPDALPAAARRAGGAALGARGPPPSALVGGDATGGDAGRQTARTRRRTTRWRASRASARPTPARATITTTSAARPRVIFWRHAAPVKLAVNVPADRLPASPAAADYAPSAARARRRRRRRRAAPRRARGGGRGGDAAADGGGGAASPRAAADSFELRRERFGKRMNYGAWYLPVDQWSSRKPHGAADPAALAAQLAGSGIGAGAARPEAAAEAAAAAAAAEVEAAHHERCPSCTRRGSTRSTCRRSTSRRRRSWPTSGQARSGFRTT